MVTDPSFDSVTDLEWSSFQDQDLFLSAGAKADRKCRELTPREATGTTDFTPDHHLKIYTNSTEICSNKSIESI